MNEIILEFTNLKKGFGETEVLKEISLSIEKGEFITFLGPSGCGKTTMLRIIAGLETPESGNVYLSGKDITHLEPNKRNVNTIFQNYALFPHMNVFQNIAYSLKLKKVPKPEIRQRVEEMLKLVQLENFEKRFPSELSGGQKQRVAIARALINHPSVLLLDEPLGALDLQLRRQMQTELKRLQKQLGITFIYITHDQEEAINMSDRIVVMKDGVLEQIGTPSEVYDHPETSFVAEFVGSSNILTGSVCAFAKGGVFLDLYGGKAFLETPVSFSDGQTVTLSVRRENLLLTREQTEASSVCATVTESSYVAGLLKICVRLEDGTELISARHGIQSDFQVGDRVYCHWTAAQPVKPSR